MNRFQRLVTAWRDSEIELAPITGLLRIRPVSLGDGEAVVKVEAGERLHNAMGTVHGGVLLDLADVAMGVAMATRLEEGEGFATLQSGITYLHAVRAGLLSASARVIQRGRTTGHLECTVTDEEERPVARITSTCLIQAPSEH